VRRPRRIGIGRPLALILTLALAVPARGSELTDAQVRLEQLRTEIASHEAALEIRHRHLDRLQARIADLVAASAGIRAELTRVRGELAEAQADHAAIRERLDEAARTAYERGVLGPVVVALGADSMGDLSDRVQYFDRISASNAELAEELNARAAKLMADLSTAQTLSAAVARQDLRLRAKEATMLEELERQASLLDDVLGGEAREPDAERLTG